LKRGGIVAGGCAIGLFDSFLGNDQRKDIEAANDRATASLAKGKDESIGTRNQYLERSLGFLKPGLDSQNVLLRALGVQGQGPQQQYYDEFQNDPGFEAATQYGINALDRSAAAKGGLFSGGQMKAVSDFGLRRQNDAFNNRINQLFQLTGNAPAMSAAATQDTGGQIADTQFGYGQLQANQATNFGNAMAASRSIPINNLLSLASSGAKVASGAMMMSDRRAKTDIKKVGALDNGLPVYSFKYKGQTTTQIGLMADDVERVIPDAVVTGPHGFKMVNYEMAAGGQ
jgi:hypothetical protein